jgi:predicted dehydrogenase
VLILILNVVVSSAACALVGATREIMIGENMSQIRIAVVGAGLIGRRHIQLIRHSERCSLIGIVDTAPAAAQFSAELGVPYFRSLETLLAQQRPDGIILATPNQFHAEQGLLCISSGVPTLIEKPLAHTLDSGSALCKVAEETHVPILVGHCRRHSSIMEQAIQIIDSGVLGNIVAVVGMTLFYKAENEGYFSEAPWRKEIGGGPILINLIHEVDALRALCGEVIAVQAFSSNATRKFVVEDTAAITLRFANDALGTFMLSDTSASDRSWEHTSGEDPRYSKAHAEESDCYLISGTYGSLAIPSMRLLRYSAEADRSWHKPLSKTFHRVEILDPLERQLAHFCDVIEGKAIPVVSARDGLQNLRVVAAISEAARTGRPVTLEPASAVGVV